MKKENVITVLLGFVPFILGWMTNWLLFGNVSVRIIVWFAALYGPIVWAALSYAACRMLRSVSKTMLLINAVAFIDLLLIYWQEMVRQQYFGGFIGACTQFYYLPWLRWGVLLAIETSTMVPAYFMSFLVMLICSYLGCKMAVKR